jgi:hypothetical protein
VPTAESRDSTSGSTPWFLHHQEIYAFAPADGCVIDLNARTQERWCDLRIYGELNYWRNPAAMRVSMAAIVALLILNFVDEHFYGGRYTQAAVTIASQIARSFG